MVAVAVEEPETVSLQRDSNGIEAENARRTSSPDGGNGGAGSMALLGKNPRWRNLMPKI